MTWIRCSDRMPMGEACEVRTEMNSWGGTVYGPLHRFGSATVETLRSAFSQEVDMDGWHWIDRTEWRPVEELKPHDMNMIEIVRDVFREPLLSEQMPEDETLRAALRRYGFEAQLSMLTEECGELVAAINRHRRGRPGAFEAMVEEMADVSILIDQMRLVYGEEIRQARARKMARLEERLGR